MVEHTENIVEIVVIVSDELGLHARPAASIAHTAMGFKAEIVLCLGDTVANAKSILEVLSLAAPKGSELTLQCQGPDAAEAAIALSQLFCHPLASQEP